LPRIKFLDWRAGPADAPPVRASLAGLVLSGVFLTWIFYATTVLLLLLFIPSLPLPLQPVAFLQPFRIANQYGLFAVMTRERYEIEFQGSRDGKQWVTYPFRYKPQDPMHPPGIYAPYQPRFDWNLWFASLSNFEHNPWVMQTEELMLNNDPSVLSLFRSNPFSGKPPLQVRAPNRTLVESHVPGPLCARRGAIAKWLILCARMAQHPAPATSMMIGGGTL
jgi:hypothetical protein